MSGAEAAASTSFKFNSDEAGAGPVGSAAMIPLAIEYITPIVQPVVEAASTVQSANIATQAHMTDKYAAIDAAYASLEAAYTRLAAGYQRVDDAYEAAEYRWDGFPNPDRLDNAYNSVYNAQIIVDAAYAQIIAAKDLPK